MITLLSIVGAAPAICVELSDGILVEPAAGRVYIMSPEQAVEALEITDGRTVWRSKAAAKPLALSEGFLISQIEPTFTDDALHLSIIDAQHGLPIRAVAQELPGVDVRIDDGISSRFTARAVSVDDAAFITWRSDAVPRSGMPSVVEKKISTLPQSTTNAVPQRRTEGTLRLEVPTGRIGEVAKSAAPPNLQAMPDTALSAASLGESTDPMQRLSADGRHLMKSRLIGNAEQWEKYQWLIFDVASGDEVGKHQSPWSQVPFIVVGNQLVYQSTPFRRRVGSEMVVAGPEVHVIDLRSHNEIWARPVRDTAYRGPFPP